jgi:hypothetical protein
MAECEVGAVRERLHLARPLAVTACDVLPVACGNARGAAVVGRQVLDGLDGAALCHDLFGVCESAAHGAACVRFRCGPPRDAEGVGLQFVAHACCHRSSIDR